MSHDRNHFFEKGPFVYKFVEANLLSKFTQLFNAVVCMDFFKVSGTCKGSILTTRQRMTSDLYMDLYI